MNTDNLAAHINSEILQDPVALRLLSSYQELRPCISADDEFVLGVFHKGATDPSAYTYIPVSDVPDNKAEKATPAGEPGCYNVTVTETLQRVITVTADSESEAIESVHASYSNAAIILGADDLVETAFEIAEQ